MGPLVMPMTGFLTNVTALEQVIMDQNVKNQACFLRKLAIDFIKLDFSGPGEIKVLFENHLKDCDPNPCVNGKCDFNSNKVNEPYCDCGVGFNGTACEITVCDTNKKKFLVTLKRYSK